MKVRLGTFRDYMSLLIVEGRVEDAREKFPELEDETIEQIVANQPAGSNNKYLLWTCKQVDEGFSVEVTIQAVRLFNGNIQRLKERDINKYEEPGDIEEAVDALGKSKSQKKAEVRADTDVIYEDERFTVLRPHTEEASCKYGIGTKWCIAATASRNYFSQYSTSNNKFYFIIDKTLPPTDPASKFALAVIGTAQNQIQVYNAPDHLVDMSVVSKHVGEKWPEIWKKIEAHVKANPLTREVEEQQKATEQLAKEFLEGKQMSDQAVQKIANEGRLTEPVMKAIIKRYENYSGPSDYRDRSSNITYSFSRRIGEMTSDVAMLAISFVASTKPQGQNKGYWNGSYYLEQMIRDANLAPEAFRKLAAAGDENVLSLIMSNPNLSPEVQKEIGDKVPDFKDKEAQFKAYWELIKKGDITLDQFRVALEKHPRLVGNILSSPETVKLKPEMIRLIPINTEHELKALLRLPNLPPDYAADAIDKAWTFVNKRDLFDILRTATIPLDKVEQLWNGKGQDVRTALLYNPSIGAENASKFARSKNSAYRFSVAHNTVTPPDDLAELSIDPSVSTRAAVAANPNTPAGTLARLASDRATAVRASLASNAVAPRNILAALKRDSDEFVRKAVRKTLKSLEAAETYIRMVTSMSSLINEEMKDEEGQDIMTPDWIELPSDSVTTGEFVAIFLLQNNGAATREEINEAWLRWPGRPRGGGYYGRHRGRRRYYGSSVPEDVWKLMRREERDSGRAWRTTTAQGNGWFWSPPGINKGALFRLTPLGASAAMNVLSRLRSVGRRDGFAWRTRPAAAARMSAPAPELDPNRANEPAAPRGPKTTYKIYGRFKGHPVATRLKGQAYVGPANTEFKPGEQAYISPGDDGKLKVKKTDSEHTQDWDPVDG